MAIDDLAHLRDELPEVFSDLSLPGNWEEDWLFIPIEEPESDYPSTLNRPVEHVDIWSPEDAFDSEALLPKSRITDLPTSIPVLGVATSFAGAPQRGGWLSPMPPPDAFAFYLPFHYFYPTWWGVYIILENAMLLAEWVDVQCGGQLSRREAIAAVRIFLFAHEAFHHSVESFATRLEITHRSALYKNGFQDLFGRTVNKDDCNEELLATAYAYRRVKERFARAEPLKRKAALRVLKAFIEQCPPGYRRAPEAFRDEAFERFRNEFAEANQRECLSRLPGKQAALWACFPHAFSGLGRVNSRVNYVVRRDSPLATRLALNLRYISYRELREKLQSLAHCEPVRSGHGSHEIWQAPNGHKFPVPRHPGDINRGLLAGIVKQAGLDMSLSQFLAA